MKVLPDRGIFYLVIFDVMKLGLNKYAKNKKSSAAQRYSTDRLLDKFQSHEINNIALWNRRDVTVTVTALILLVAEPKKEKCLTLVISVNVKIQLKGSDISVNPPIGICK